MGLSYYILTSTFAIITGLVLVNIIKPGIGADLNFSQPVEGLVEKQRSLGQTLVEIIPENIFEAFNSSAMLSIIFFAIVFGFFITRVENPHRDALRRAFNAIFEVMMQITMFVIKFTPLGIFGIVTRKNAIMVLMGLELVLNAANINFVAFSKYGGFDIEGHVATIFVIILAAAEAAVALAIVLNIYQNYKHINVDEVSKMKD